MCGCLLLGIGIWLAVDRNFLTTIIGNNLYAAAVFIILAGGVVLFFISFFGCCGAINESFVMLAAFFITLCIVAFFLLVGGILAIIFQAQIGDKIRNSMSTTLTNYYGFGFDSDYNRAVTDAWDRAQERLQCCAVSTNGWYLYRQSQWFTYFGAQDSRSLTYEESNRPYVPLSCCVKDRLWRYINQQVCQLWRIGPPGSPADGAINRALYYEGCFDAGYAYLKSNSVILIGLGIAIGLMLIVGIIVSGLILLRTRRSSQTAKGY